LPPVRRNVNLKALAYSVTTYYTIYYSFTDPPLFIQVTLATHIIKRGTVIKGARGSVVVKALCCKPEGRGFKSR
jgi:hypothetical protein